MGRTGKGEQHERLRGPENPRSRGYSPARDMREAAAAPDAGGTTPSSEAPRPAEGELAAEKFKIGKYEVSEADVGAMMERQALDDLRKATVPASPDAYKAELPPDLKLPGGLEYKFDAGDPSLAAARTWAHQRGLSQSEFSEVLSIYATHVAAQEFAMAERSRQEIAKAGANGPQRVDAVGRWITGMVGAADAEPIRRTLVTDAHLRFFEKIITQITNQGGVGLASGHAGKLLGAKKVKTFGWFSLGALLGTIGCCLVLFERSPDLTAKMVARAKKRKRPLHEIKRLPAPATAET